MAPALVGLCIAAVIFYYFRHNPLHHSSAFVFRRFVNWFPLGMTYAFLYMARYNLNVSKNAFGAAMSKEDFGLIFGAGTVVYGLSFLLNGPLVDRFGGKRGMIIASIGAGGGKRGDGIGNVLVFAWADCRAHDPGLFGPVFDQHVLSKLRRRFHHQGEGLLVSPCASAGSSVASSAR